MSLIIPCRPCLSTVALCPDLFAGGSAVTPIPTRQRVCNTAQTASCSDGSQPKTVEAGTFCTVVLNPTATSIATAQAAMNAQALAQAQSMVGDCAWVNMEWSNRSFNPSGIHTGATFTGIGNKGVFSATAAVPCVNPNNGSWGVFLTGDIVFTYGPGVVKHHRLSGSFVNIETLCGGVGSGVFQSQITLLSAAPPNPLSVQNDIHSNPINESHFSGDADRGLGTFPFSWDFTSPGTSPWVFELRVSTTVYTQTNVQYNQSISGHLMALD